MGTMKWRGTLGSLTVAEVGGRMERRTYCVYNETRECFLSLNVKAVNTTFPRLGRLTGRLKRKSDEGIWAMPPTGIHILGLLFPLDLIYLDEHSRVIHLVEYFSSFRIGPLKTQAASVLELPTHTIYSSNTQSGDQLVICVAEEMEHQLSMSGTRMQQPYTGTNR
jgi:hypothetical protein